MADIEVKLRLIADGSVLVSTAQEAEDAIGGVGSAAERTGDQGTRGFDQLGRSAANAKSEMGQVRSSAVALVAAIGGLAAIKGIATNFIQAADAQGQLDARMRRVSSSISEQEAATARLQQVAHDAYVDINDVVEVYVRSIEPMRQLGYTTGQTLDLTEALSLSMVVSASAADKRATAIDALSKAMQTGIVKTEQLEAILNGAPRFVEALETALGKTRAELLAMASASELSVEQLAKVSSELGMLRAEVEDMPTTLEDASLRFASAFQTWAGKTNEQLGLTEKLVFGVDTLAGSLDSLASVLGTIATAGALAFGGRVLNGIGAYATKLVETVAAASALREIERQSAAAAVQAARGRAIEAAANLEAVTAMRQQYAAKLALSAAEVKLAESTLAATGRMGAQSAALRYQRVATEELTTAKARQAAITNELAILGQQQVRLETALIASANAKIAAQTRVAGAVTATAYAMTQLRAVGSQLLSGFGSLLSALGGWSTAVLAGAYGTYKLYEALSEGNSTARENVQTLDQMSEALERASDRQSVLAKGAPEAMAEQASALAKAREEIEALQASQESLTLSWLDAIPVIGAYTLYMSKINAAGIEQQNEAIERYVDSLVRSVAASNDVARAANDAIATLSAAGIPIDSLVEKIAGLNTGLTRTYDHLFLISTVKLGAEQVAALAALRTETEKSNSALLEQIATFGKGRVATVEYSKSIELAKAATITDTAVRQLYVDGVEAAFAPLIANARALDGLTAAQKGATEAQRDEQRRQREAIRDSERAAEARIKFRDELLQMEATLSGPVRAAEIEHEQRQAVLEQRFLDGEIAVLDYYKALQLLGEQYGRTSAEARAQEDVLGNLNRSYAEQAALAGMTEQQRRVEQESLAAIAQWRRVHKTDIDAETEAMIRQSVEIGEAQVETARVARETADAANRAWVDFFDGLADAVLDGSDGVKRYFKRLLDDLKAQLISSGLIRIFASIFGGSFSGTAAAGGQGGSLSMLGQMFGLTGGAGGGVTGAGGSASWNPFGGAGNQLYNSALGMFTGYGSFGTQAGWNAAAAGGPPSQLAGGSGGLGVLGTAAAGLGGAYYGYQRSGNIAGAVGYGALGIGVAGTAAGIAGGATVGAAAGGAFSALGASAAIPIIGWIAAIAALIDLATGGKLFGTKFRAESAQSTLAIGADGASASTSLTEVRNRSLFRGREWRTREIESGDEAIDAASQLWEAVNQVMVDSARQLRAEAPAVIEAALRTVQEFDKKGKVKATAYFVDVLGQSFEEASAELAATRISAEAIIATIDSVLGTTVAAGAATAGRELIEGLADGLAGAGGIGENAGQLIGRIIGDAIPKTTGAADVQGEASAIAQRWRDDAEVLMQGAQFLLLVATDMRAGFDLLDTGTLTPIVDLVEELAINGEDLVATYQRITAATLLLDEALALSGVELSGTREDLVRFAVEIAEAAGGLDRASQLWSTYFDAFFSANERAELGLARARESAASRFTTVGLDVADFAVEGGMPAFRALFEQALPTLSAEAVVQWLEAAEALAQLNGAQAAYNQTLGESSTVVRDAQAIAEIIAGLNTEDFLAGLSDIDRELAESAIRYQEAAAAAAAAGASESELLQIRRLGERAAARIQEAAAQRAAEEAEQRAASLNELLEGLNWDATLSGMTALDRQLAESARRFEQLEAQALALGASEDQLTVIRNHAAAAAGAIIATEAQRAAVEAERAAQVQLGAVRSYSEFIVQLRAGASELSAFGAAMLEANRWRFDAIETANRHAQAAGLAATREQDLVAIELRAAEMRAAAMAQLRESMAGLAAELGYARTPDTIDYLNQRIGELSQASVSAADGVGQAAESIRGSLDLLLSDLSPYNDNQKLEIARGGLATGAVTQEQFLEIAQRLFGRATARYTSEFQYAQQFGGQGAPQDAGTRAIVSAIRESSSDTRTLAELIADRDALLVQQRVQSATTLARQLAEYAGESGADFAAIAQGMGWSIDDLAEDLSLTNEELIDYLDTLAERFGMDQWTNSAEYIADAIAQQTEQLLQALGAQTAGIPLKPRPLAADDEFKPSADFETVPFSGGKPMLPFERIDVRVQSSGQSELGLLRAELAEVRAELARITGNTGRGADASKRVAEHTGALADVASHSAAAVDELRSLRRDLRSAPQPKRVL
jgi:tape measure domain-containing protein